ncbi:MAG: uracil-DNA glycosylase family protein [Roseobacter sp.]
MESTDFHSALAALDWQIELGATETIADAPINRYETPEKAPAMQPISAAAQARPAGASTPAEPEDVIDAARRAASAAMDLHGLRDALASFEHCELKKGARNLVFSDGQPGAPVMFIGEAPGRDEDIAGTPFVGQAGQLLDKMLAAIDMGRTHAHRPVYITNVLPWRPPQNRDPAPQEIAMMRPFVSRHIELAQPKMVVIVGNISAQCLLGKRGITRLRGHWTEADGVPALPIFHPAYLLRNPAAKREAWADLLALKKRVSGD